MPSKVVDLSARSEIIRNEPFGLHFWECNPAEYLTFLKDPRAFLAEMGIKLPKDCRIETVIENHDWISANTNKMRLGWSGHRLQCRWWKCRRRAQDLPHHQLRAQRRGHRKIP